MDPYKEVGKLFGNAKLLLDELSFIRRALQTSSFMPSVVDAVVGKYLRGYDDSCKWLRDLYKRYEKPTVDLEKMLRQLGFYHGYHSNEMLAEFGDGKERGPNPWPNRTFDDLKECWWKVLDATSPDAETIVAKVEKQLEEYLDSEWILGITPPGGFVPNVFVPNEFPKDANRVDVLAYGEPCPVTFPYWKLLKAMDDARPTGLTKDEILKVNQNGLTYLRTLREQRIEWQMGISMAGKEKARYRLN